MSTFIRRASHPFKKKLPSDDYVLSAQAANGDCYGMKISRKMHICVLPPWWLSWHAYAAYLFIAGGLLFLMARLLWLPNALRKENELCQAKLSLLIVSKNEDKLRMDKYTCPYCGYKTLDEEPEG